MDPGGDTRQSLLQRVRQSQLFYSTVLGMTLFLTMVVGMIVKAIYDSLLNNENITPGWDVLWRKDFILPVLVSPMVFGAIYGYLRDSPTNMLTFIFAFQNGFFWKTIFAGLDKPTSFPQ